MVEALASLGVDARVGEVPGEYCPGEYSVNAGGRRKLMGVGQRLVAGAAHVGGVVVVDRPDLVNRALAPVYSFLGFAWDPAATGSVADTVAASMGRVADALVAALARRHEVEDAPLPHPGLGSAERGRVPGSPRLPAPDSPRGRPALRGSVAPARTPCEGAPPGSDVTAREEWRAALGHLPGRAATISGHGLDGYRQALEFLATRGQAPAR